jgi:hypothetical protein
MAALIHFVASWADAICSPHRSEAEAAAQELGLSLWEVDVDNDPDAAREYHVPNVPAVVIEGRPGTLLVGALPADEMVRRLRIG